MAIFGQDDRLAIVSGYDSPPLAAFAQVASLFPDGSVTQGSGVLIGPNDLLTAAHVIYREEYGGWVTQVQVTPGRYLDKRPHGVLEATSISVPIEWRVDGLLAYDYGFITLDSSAGYITGWFNYGYVDETVTFVGHEMVTLGYPYDKGGDVLYYNNGTIDRIDGDILYFTDDLDIMPGQSGSPLIYDNDGSYIVLGVVSHQLISPDENGIISLTEESVSQIQGWTSYNNDEVIISSLNPLYYQTEIDTSIKVVRLVEIIYNQQPGYEILVNFNNQVMVTGITAFSNHLIASEQLLREDDSLSAIVLANSGITGDAALVAMDYLDTQLEINQDARGEVILDAVNLFSELTDDQLFGEFAMDYNSEVVASIAYSIIPENSGARAVEDTLPITLLL